jgi:hypothetical protein
MAFQMSQSKAWILAGLLSIGLLSGLFGIALIVNNGEKSEGQRVQQSYKAEDSHTEERVISAGSE